MMNAKNEIQYILVIQVLEEMAKANFLSDEELAEAKRLAVKKYRSSTVWE